MKNLSTAEENHTEYEELSSLSDLEEETEEHGNNQEDIKVVDGALFIQKFHSKCRDVWVCKNKKSPAAARKSNTKPQQGVSKGLDAGHTRKSKQSSRAGVKKKTTHPNTETVSKNPPRRKSGKCSAKEKSTQSLASHESSSGTKGGNQKRGKENPCSTQVLQTSQTGQGHRAPHCVTSQRPGVSARGGKHIDVIAQETSDDETDIEANNLQTQSHCVTSQGTGMSARGGKHIDIIAQETSDDETDIEENNLQTQSLSDGSARHDGLRQVSGAVESLTALSHGGATMCERTIDMESSTCSDTTDCRRNNNWTLSELHSPVGQTETETHTDTAVDCEGLPAQVHTDKSDSLLDVGEAISYCKKPQRKDTTATEAGLRYDSGANLTSDDESQSLLDPQASRIQKTRDNMVSSESFQGLWGDKSFMVPYHRTERKRKKDDTKQSKAARESPVSFSKDSMLVNLPDAVRGDLQNKVRAAFATQHSPGVQEHHTSSQKKRRTVNKEKSDTGDAVLEGNNDHITSQSHEQLEQNETEVTLIQSSTKKKKKHKKDKKKDSLSVHECGTHEDDDGILQNALLSPVPETEGETSSLKKKKKKHKNRQNLAEIEPEDAVQQQSEEQINLYPPEAQSQQPTDRKKKKKRRRASGALEFGENFSHSQTPSLVETTVANEVLSQVCVVSSDTLNSPAKKKKKKKKKEKTGVMEAPTGEEHPPLTDASSFSQQHQVTSSQEMAEKKKLKRGKNKNKLIPGGYNSLEAVPDVVSDASKQLQVNEAETCQDPAQYSGLSQAPVPPEQSDGPGVGKKRKKKDNNVQANICSNADPEAEALHPKKRKKKRHRSESPCNSAAMTESDQNRSQGQLEVAERQTTLPSSHSIGKDQSCVGNTPEGHSVELKEGHKSKGKRKKKRDSSLVSDAVDANSRSDTDAHQAETIVPDEQVCLSPVGHKKKKKKKKSRDEMSSEVTLGDANVPASFISETGSVASAGQPPVELDTGVSDATRVTSGDGECPALLMPDKEEKRRKKKKSKHKHSDVQEDAVLTSSPMPPNLMSDPEDAPQPKKKKKKKKKDSLL
ncbi:hypothetical protein ACEWY4_009755 [Coilia grayii]|uniref:Uncharacterized protein n=1 Tax=Coilia grayii TaxID=363190 RepID=A0ABD1K7C1_9TELE